MICEINSTILQKQFNVYNTVLDNLDMENGTKQHQTTACWEHRIRQRCMEEERQCQGWAAEAAEDTGGQAVEDTEAEAVEDKVAQSEEGILAELVEDRFAEEVEGGYLSCSLNLNRS